MSISKITEAISPVDKTKKINDIIEAVNGITVNNSTVTFKQGDVVKGTMTTNQASNSVIELDAGGGNQGAGRNIGEIIQSTIPLTDAGLHLLDGSLLSGDGVYSDFVDYIASLYNVSDWYCWVRSPNIMYYTQQSNYNVNDTIELYTKVVDSFVLSATGTVMQVSSAFIQVELPNLDYLTFERNSAGDTQAINPACFTTESDWQTSVTTYGVCGKFVYDSENNTVRLPKITKFIEGTIDVTSLGALTEAGLPDHTHYLTRKYGDASPADSEKGYFCSESSSTTRLPMASRYNAIYGNSNTVQPQSIKVLYYIVVANSTKTEIEVDIDNIATELNTCLDTKRYDGQWVSNYTTLAQSINFSAETTTTYDLSSYLPNDGYSYEIAIRVSGNTGTTSGNTFETSVYSDIMTNQWSYPLCSARTRSSSNVRANGCAIVPVGIGRYIKLYVSGTGGLQSCYITISGYRRIGTNS